MRTFLSLLFAFVFLTFSGEAQSYNRNYIGLSIGPSFTLGNFAKTNYSDSISGWAKTGVMLEFDYAYRITHNFGAIGIISFSSNAFNNLAYRDSLDVAHPDTTFSVEGVSNWSGGGIMIGPYLRFPLGENLSWDIRAVFGLYGGTTPRITIRATDDITGEELEPFTQQPHRAFSFAYLIGTGFKYRLSNYYILLFGDYTSTSLQFDNYYQRDVYDQAYETPYKQKIEYFSVTAGVGYFF